MMVIIDIASFFFLDHEPRYKLLFANDGGIKKTLNKNM